MYRQSVVWLVRAFEDHGGDPASLADIRSLFTRPIIEAAIRDQIQRSKSGRDLKDPLSSTTLPARLASLTTLARRGLEDAAATAILKLLGKLHYDIPRAKLKRSKDQTGVQMAVDALFDLIRQRPELLAIWGDAPRRIAGHARDLIEKARAKGHVGREITGLRLFAGAVAFAIQLSRPMRTACLRHARIEAVGDANNSLLRTAPGQKIFTFRFAPWEIKNVRWVNVDVVGHDAEILREWLEKWRPRMLEVKGIKSVYLFPGAATPKYDEGDPVHLPQGCFATSAFLEVWRDAAEIVGFDATPHRMRHFVALSILSSHPGNYAKVASVLANTEKVCREHYGRDDGQAAAQESRAAMVSRHPEIFSQLRKRHAYAK